MCLSGNEYLLEVVIATATTTSVMSAFGISPAITVVSERFGVIPSIGGQYMRLLFFATARAFVISFLLPGGTIPEGLTSANIMSVPSDGFAFG